MKNILFVSSAVFYFNYSFCQCSPAIPSNAIVITTNTSTGSGGKFYWVCSGDSLYCGGGNNTVYLESGAYFSAGGGVQTVYVPTGAKINLSSGNNIIYYENPADIISAGGSPVLTLCTSIVYDYTNAPSPGCSQSTGVHSVENNFDVNIFPVPTNGIFYLEANHFQLSTLEIKNIFGETILNASINSMPFPVDITGALSGIYFLRIKSGEKIANKKIILLK